MSRGEDMVSQFATPIVIQALDGPFDPVRLVRLRSTASSGSPAYAEKLLQQLIHAHPSMLPVEELEFSFSGLRPICQELPLAGGTKYVDNLLANPDGRICIVECKLWRNPEAVREVIAQDSGLRRRTCDFIIRTAGGGRREGTGTGGEELSHTYGSRRGGGGRPEASIH